MQSQFERTAVRPVFDQGPGQVSKSCRRRIPDFDCSHPDQVLPAYAASNHLIPTPMPTTFSFDLHSYQILYHTEEPQQFHIRVVRNRDGKTRGSVFKLVMTAWGT